MSDSPVRAAQTAVEQEHVDRVYARLATLRTEAREMRDRGFAHGHGAGTEATLEQANMLMERDVMVAHANRLLAALESEHAGLVFGRLDTTSGETLHVGRMGVRDEGFRNLVTDWRAPAAAAFYQATSAEPMGMLRRRVIRCLGERVVDIDDDLLDTGTPLPDGVVIVGEGALMAALGRARGETMSDIVATIQKEQDEAIRAPFGGVTEITGGPGTGKTAVALHRVAYLLYRERHRLGRYGVLVVGPSPVFTNYISRVLPSMGENDAELSSLADLVPGVGADHVDPAPVAAVKGSTRMRQVLRGLTRQEPPGAPTELRITYQGEVLRLGTDELDAIRRSVHRRNRPPNRCRMRAADALLEALWRKADSYADGRFKPVRGELITDLGERMEFHRFLVRWWPPLRPVEVLSWARDRHRLRAAARHVLSEAEITLLADSWGTGGWSVADIALLDELRELLGRPRIPRSLRHHPDWRFDPTSEYSHVVVDESQDLSPMQWRMVGRRGRFASWTIVGDPVQTSWPVPREADSARQEALNTRNQRHFLLRTNYRNPAEIFALAATVVDTLARPEQLPVAVRTTGVEPVVSVVGPDGLPGAVNAAARALLREVEGTVGVITAMNRVTAAREWVSDVDDPRLRVLGGLEAKGLEYDATLVIEPADLVAESPTGRRTLYVAMTRATQRMTILTTTPDWR